MQTKQIYKKKRHTRYLVCLFCAESEGFEPPNPLRSTVFKTAAFDHSANSPKELFPSKGTANVVKIFYTANFFARFYKKQQNSLTKILHE